MLLLPDVRRAELYSWMRAGYPHETCGLLIGRVLTDQARALSLDDPDPERDHPERDHPERDHPERDHPERDHQEDKPCTEVVRVAQARNLNSDRAHDRYELDPQDFMRADQEAREAGLEIVGIWHSHPDHPAEPSETDRVTAWEGWSYLIATVTADGVPAVRSWRLAGELFAEETLTA